MIGDLVAVFVGLASSLIGVVSLTETHRESPMCQRWSTGGLILLCALVALDGFFSWSEAGDEADPLAVAFALFLGITWGLRVWFARKPKRNESAPALPG